MICVSANYHWAKMTSGVFILADIDHFTKISYANYSPTTVWSIMVTYLIFYNMN